MLVLPERAAVIGLAAIKKNHSICQTNTEGGELTGFEYDFTLQRGEEYVEEPAHRGPDDQVTLARDTKNRRLISSRRKPQFMVMMEADNGKVIQSFPISAGVGANVFEPATGLLFVSTREGMIHIFREDSPDKLSEVETVKTEYGAKTMQIDPKTRNLFLSTSDFDPPASRTEKQPNPLPRAKPGSFRVVVYGH